MPTPETSAPTCGCCAEANHHDGETIVELLGGLEYRVCERCRHWSIGAPPGFWNTVSEARLQELQLILLAVQSEEHARRATP